MRPVRPSEDEQIFDNLSSSHDCTWPAPEKTIGNQWAQSDRFSDLSKLDPSHWPIWPVHEAFGDPKSPGHKPSNEGHGFSRAVNSRALTASATEVRFSRATGAVPSLGQGRVSSRRPCGPACLAIRRHVEDRHSPRLPNSRYFSGTRCIAHLSGFDDRAER